MVDMARPRFELGRLVATPGALRVLEAARQPPAEFLDRHIRGDWGDVCPDDRQANEQAVRDGSRILSAYRTEAGRRIWIITEAAGEGGGRSATTILLPEEY